jgi:hypothetical protein
VPRTEPHGRSSSGPRCSSGDERQAGRQEEAPQGAARRRRQRRRRRRRRRRRPARARALGGLLARAQQPKKEKAELSEEDLAFKEKQKAEAKALKDMQAKLKGGK